MDASGVIEVGWTTADYALIVSICSAVFSFFALVWNIYSKFMLPKGKLKLWLFRSELDDPSYYIEAVNNSPVEIIVRYPIILERKRNLFSRDWDYWGMENTKALPDGGKALGNEKEWPRKIAPRELLSIRIPKTILGNGSGSLLGNSHGIGFIDSFGRFHMVPKLQFRELVEVIRKGQS